MPKNKLLIAIALFSMGCISYARPAVLTDVNYPKPPAYRVGISDTPEQQYVQAVEDINSKKPEKKYARIDNSKEGEISDMTYADLSIKQLSKEIAQELEYEEKEMLADLSLLWQGAAVQSDTINFALYKLANPDADKPDEKSIKNVLKTIASMSTLVGASVGSPIIAGSSLIGGNIFNIFAQDTKALNYKYTKVNDADMIILIRKVEDLQQRAVDLYYDYMSSKKQLEFAAELVDDRKNKFESAQKNNAPRELIVITDAYYRTALDKQKNARADFFSKRAALEQFVGHDTFVQFETELAARENPENLSVTADKEEYDNTIKSVEDYTNNLKNLNESEDVQPINYDVENNVNLPSGGFYSDFPTGFASPATLDEFLTTGQTVHKEKIEKVHTSKVTKQKPVKEKIKKVKEIKEKPPKKQPEKVVKEMPAKLEKAPKVKKEKPQKLKNKTIKFDKIKTKKQSNTNEVNELKDIIPPMVENEEMSSENKEENLNEQPAVKKEKAKKIKKDKPQKQKKVKEKKVKDNTEYAYGQPLTKYPRNSTKDLIFLHGQDKRSVPSILLQRQKKALGISEDSETTSLIAPQLPSVDPMDDLKMLDEAEINSSFHPQTLKPITSDGLLPLDDIKVPELKHDGYSIHSETQYY